PDWVGKTLYVQVIGPGENDPTLLGDPIQISVPGPNDPPITFAAQPNGPWLFLRIMDPARTKDPLGVPPFEQDAFGGALAYASPWFFDAS
ncbi:MAG: hypothetical protein ABR552_11160, partial [Actinomycetota bacterium]